MCRPTAIARQRPELLTLRVYAQSKSWWVENVQSWPQVSGCGAVSDLLSRSEEETRDEASDKRSP